MLTIKGVSRRFGGKLAVDDVSLEIAPGSFVGVVGRSGAGKSTLLRTINRRVEPTTGSIEWHGADVTALRGRALRDWRARCAMIFQQFNLVGQLDVLNNVLIGRLNDMPTARALLRLWRPAAVAGARGGRPPGDPPPAAPPPGPRREGPASAFTAAAARDLYGMEADEVLDAPPVTSPVEGFRAAALA